MTLARANQMSKWILYPAIIVGVPIICLYMLVRHPRKVWQEARRSWRMISYGEYD